MDFQEIYGHKKTIAILKSAMANGRVAHAYLFYGMEGVGKRTAARLFAKALNCTGEHPPCDKCPSCRKAEHKNHPNILTIGTNDPFIKIDAVKEIGTKMTFRPESGKRVFILEDADRMNPPAANALLKTLEEPSPNNVLILTTARPHALPATILSRCQSLRFAPLPNEEVSRYLQEKEGFEANQADAMAAASMGSIGRALKMIKDDYLAMITQIMQYLAGDNPGKLMKRISFARSLAGKERQDLSQHLDILKTAYRDGLTWAETHEEKMLIFKGYREAIAAIAGRLAGREILRNIAIIDQTIDAVSKNANKTLTLESMLVRLF